MSPLPPVDVLVPTYRRPAALAVTLAGLSAQTLPRFRVVVSDQTPDEDTTARGEVQAVVRLLRARGREVELHRHLPARGIAEHRDSLLARARAPYALFLDDDVLLEPDVLARLLRVLVAQRCGFAGAAMTGLSHLDDERLHEQEPLRVWDGPVVPERVRPGDVAWERWRLHNAATPWHLAARTGATDARPVLYRVAWVAGCVLYDVAKLRDVGGFGFWRDLPPHACGEDVTVQLRLLERYGGCGVLPSGAVHQQLETTLPDRSVDAPLHLDLDLPPELQAG